MSRPLPVLAFALVLFTACTTARPAVEPVDPVIDPTIIGAIDEAALQGSLEAERAARTGRRIGRVAGVLAAVFGGPEVESVDDMVARYRNTRDAVMLTSVLVAGVHGAVEGAQRGHERDVEFAELHAIAGIEVMRPYPDEIDLRIASCPPDDETIAAIAAVLAGGEQRVVEIDAAGAVAFDVRESLLGFGVDHASVSAHRNDAVAGVVIRILDRN